MLTKRKLAWWRGIWIANGVKGHFTACVHFRIPSSAATIPADKELYQRQIEATDRQVDGLVCELYGLTEEEVGVVEGRNH